MTNAILRGIPDVGNLHVRFDEGGVASGKPRRGSLLYRQLLVLAGLTGVADISLAGDVAGLAVEPYGEQTVSVESGQVLQEGPIRLQKGATVYKSGAGTWSVPAGAIRGDGGTIAVRQGTLSLTAGGTATYAKPMAVLNRAALWLDATSANVVTTNGADGLSYVTEWRDVRETKTTAPYDYLRAMPRYTSSVETWATNAPPVVRTDDHGNKVVYFGRYRSGRWMALADKTAADGSSPYRLGGIRHAFIVYRALQNYWFLMGMSPANSQQCWHPQSSQASIGVFYCANNYEDDITLPMKTHYLNGVLMDPSTIRIPTGCRLLEHKYGQTLGFVDSLANCSTTTGSSTGQNREGGDDYCEIVLFTEALDEAERVAVGDYLMAKWSLTSGMDGVTIETAAGSVVEVSSSDALTVIGAGTQNVGTGADVVIQTLGDDASAQVPVSIGSGTVTVRDEVPVVAAAGKSYCAARQFDGTRTDMTDGEAAAIAKTGEGRLRLEGVPEGTKSLAVGQGELTLGVGIHTSTLLPEPQAGGAMAGDSGFEGASGGAHWATKGAVVTLCGWTFGRDPDYGTADTPDYYAGINNGTLWSNLNPYAGNCFGQIRGFAYIYTSVEIPEDGFYELSFQFAQRNANRSNVDIQFGPAGSLQTVARVFNTFASTYRQVAVSLPYVKKGTYRLQFHGINDDTQSSGVLDDVKIVRCPREEAVLQVPNGDFEVTRSRGYSKIADESTPSQLNAPDGWTILPEASHDCTAAIIGGTNGSGRTYSLACGRPGGRAQLALVGSIPTASTTFVPEQFGRFRVRSDVGRYQASAYYNRQFYNLPKVHAVLNVGGTETDVGVLTPTEGNVGQLMKRAYCPTPVEIPSGTESVTLTLRNDDSGAFALIDNIVLERCGEALEELIRDGGFEEGASSPWTFEKGEGYTDGNYGNFAQALPYTSTPQYQGRAVYEGSSRLRLWNNCRAFQSVTFTEAGDYVLRFHAAMRMDERYEPGRKGYEPFLAYVAAGDVTNVIGKSLSTTTNYIAHSWRFRIAKPGTYDVGFEGWLHPGEVAGSTCDRTAFIDGVSVRKVSASEPVAPEMPSELSVEVAADAQLRLDFAGTNTVQSVRLGGRRRSGFITAERFPGLVFGTGTLYVEPKGVLIIYR